MIELIGWLGAVALATCALPQAITTVRRGNTAGLSSVFLILWTLGEVATLIYILLTSADVILLANYITNVICLVVLLRYWAFPRREE